MLSPDDRKLYSDALRPPPGYRFDEGIATTYTLDLTTLLTFPLHLALYSAEGDSDELLRDGIALLEALRATASRLSVFCDQGRIHAPDVPRVLYCLLEPVVVEAGAPGGGAFHPKIWVLRFTARDTAKEPVIRLLLLTRNITQTRCWDLILTLDGRAGDAPRRRNRDLKRLLQRLPALSALDGESETALRCRRFADEVERCEWELPGRFESVRFHALGLEGGSLWRPLSREDLVVISPFVTSTALDQLTGDRVQANLLVSRADELAQLTEDTRGRFRSVMVIDELAESEDGEDVPEYREPGVALKGLHAKAYLYKKGWYTHVVVGSANATTAALVAGNNVEILAELRGRASRVGEPSAILGNEDFARVLAPYLHDPDAAPDDDQRRAEQLFEEIRTELAESKLRVQCAQNEAGWSLAVGPGHTRPTWSDDVAVSVWPVTLDPDKRAVGAAPLREGEPVVFQVGDVAYLTAFIAFSIRTATGHQTSYAFNLPVFGLPVEERDASILRGVIRNRAGFIRYLLLLLGQDESIITGSSRFEFTGGDGPGRSALEDIPLLEQMTRAYCRDPDRLRSVRRLIEELQAHEEDDPVVPPEFWIVWRAFETAMGDRR